MIHHLNLGSPDNIVFLTEYIEHLRDKMERNECIYCERVSPDHTTLMEHMRKKGHREVNPKNNYYDKFYVINYLELGKKWLEVLAEDFEDTTLSFADSDDDEEDDSWHEWQVDNLDDVFTSVVCLFCETTEESVPAVLEHMKKEHDFELLSTLDSMKIQDFYSRIMFINFVRRMNLEKRCYVCFETDSQDASDEANEEASEPQMSADAFKRHVQTEQHILKLKTSVKWNDKEYITAVYENDNLLWRLESYLQEERGREGEKSQASLTNQQHGSMEDDSVFDDKIDDFELVYPDGVELFPEPPPDVTKFVLRPGCDLDAILAMPLPAAPGTQQNHHVDGTEKPHNDHAESEEEYGKDLAESNQKTE